MTTPDPASPIDASQGSAPGTSSGVTAEVADKAVRKARGALSRYRFMALLTGVMLLILCVELLLNYVFKVDDDVMRYVKWIPFAHGWIYVVYLVTVLDLWSKMRWGWGRLLAMVLAGVVPVMSFILEKKVHREAQGKLDALAAQYSR